MTGRMYFIRLTDRMTRTWEPGMLPVPARQGWKKVTSRYYAAFRKETRGMTRTQLKKLKEQEA